MWLIELTISIRSVTGKNGSCVNGNSYDILGIGLDVFDLKTGILTEITNTLECVNSVTIILGIICPPLCKGRWHGLP